MENIKNSFNLNEVPLPDVDLFEVPGHYLIGSRSALKKFYLSQGDIWEFFSNNPENYFLIGFWGHGFNSHAFYYIRTDSKSKIFFRLPFGGTYMNNERASERISKFLAFFFDFENKIIDNVKEFIALESFGQAKYKIIRNDGSSFVFEKSLLRSDDIEAGFKELLRALEN